MSEKDVVPIETDGGRLTVKLVLGPHPYLWIGDSDGEHIDTFDLEGSPLNVRRKLAAVGLTDTQSEQ